MCKKWSAYYHSYTHSKKFIYTSPPLYVAAHLRPSPASPPPAVAHDCASSVNIRK
jgi:hypothetical protein